MPTYHRSQRLRLVGTGPKVEQLQEGRFRLTFTCTATNPNEAWMNGNKDQIMTAYGTLQSAQKNIAGIDPRTDEAYSDMVLFRTEANPSERDLIITLVYETATETFVKSQDDKIDFELNGLQRVTRVTIAKTGTNLPSVTIGTTALSESETDLILASKSVEENDAFIQITEVYLEQGTVSESLDNVGSQKAKVITTFGVDPSTPTNYVLASKEESNFAGYQTNTFRFLKPSILSVEESKNTPENRITVRVFDLASNDSSVSASNGAVVDTDTHILVSQSDQDYDGIKTSVYVFESDDYNTKTTNEFGRTVIDRVEQSASDFSLDDQSAEHTVDSVTNLRILSQTIENNDNNVNKKITRFTTVGIDEVREDIVGSQKAIVITKVGAEPTATEVASKSDIGYDSADDWSIARKDNSREGGLDIYTYTFLLDNTILSESQDKKGSLKTNIVEVFNPKVTIDGLTLEGGSSVAGNYFLKTQQFGGKNIYTQSQGDYFPKTVSYNTNDSAWKVSQHSGVYAVSTDTNSENEIDPPLTGWNGTGTNEVTNIIFREFDQTLPNSTYGYELSHRYDKEGYSLINIQRSNLDGIPTMRYTFAKDNAVLSVSEDKVGAQRAIVNEIFNPTSETITGVDSDNVALIGYTEVDRTESDYEGVKTIRVRFLKNDSILSVSEDFVGSQRAIVNEVFNPFQETVSGKDTSNQALSGYSEADRTESNYNGIKTIRVRFLKNGVLLSQSEDFLGSQKGIVREVFNPVNGMEPSPLGDFILVNKEQSNVSGIPTIRFSYLKQDTVLSVSEDKVGSQKAIVNEIFDPTGTISGEDASGSALSGYSEADRSISEVEGIKTVRVRFLKNNAILSTSEDLIGSQKAVIIEKFGNTAPVITDDDVNGIDLTDDYIIANKQESSVDGIKTFRYTFLKPGIISTNVDFAAASTVVQIEKFGSTAPTDAEVNTAAGTSSETYTLVSKKITNLNGINTHSYTFINTNSGIMISSKRVFEDGFTLKEAYQLSSETKTPEEIATDLATVATSGTTVDLTPNITIPIDNSANEHHTLFLDTNEDLTSVPKRFSQVLINIDTGAGDDLSSGILVNQYQTHEIFNYPGEVDVTQVDYGGNNDFSLFSGIVQVPITASIQSTVFEFIQTESSIQSSDYILDPDSLGSSSGLWRPNNWGSYHVTILGNNDRTVFEESKQWKGYRIVKPSFKVRGGGFGTNIRWEGNQYIYNASRGTFIFTSNTGPPSPVGSRWTLDVDISPIGLSAAGTPIFKKTVVITDPIPLQRENALPY